MSKRVSKKTRPAKKAKASGAKKKLTAAVRKKAKAAGPKQPAIPAVPRTPVWEISPDEQIVGATLLGKVRGFQAGTHAMTLVLEAPLAVGETIRVKGQGTDLTQRVEHMELNRLSVQSATPGETVGITVADRVRVGDAVYKL